MAISSDIRITSTVHSCTAPATGQSTDPTKESPAINVALAATLTPRPLRPDCTLPITKMALKEDRSSSDEKKSPTRNANLDAETGNRSKYGHSNGAAGGRIAPVLPHLSNYDFGDDSGSDILGKQIELEADNAIKYRTCSWQKVRLGSVWFAIARAREKRFWWQDDEDKY